MKKHLLTIALVAATAACANAQSTSQTQSTTKKDAAIVESAVRVYNPESIIFTDVRTPRFPLSDSEQTNNANYAKAKQIWIKNNPEKYAEMNKPSEMTKEQVKEREAKEASRK